jgi:hypothetical protein
MGACPPLWGCRGLHEKASFHTQIHLQIPGYSLLLLLLLLGRPPLHQWHMNHCQHLCHLSPADHCLPPLLLLLLLPLLPCVWRVRLQLQLQLQPDLQLLVGQLQVLAVAELVCPLLQEAGPAQHSTAQHSTSQHSRAKKEQESVLE